MCQKYSFFNSCIWQPNIAFLQKLETVQSKTKKWVCGLNEYKISFASIKFLPIYYQLIYPDLVLFCNILQNDIKVDDYVNFFFPRPGSRAAHRTLFDVRKCAKLQHGGQILSGQLLVPTSCQQILGVTFARRNPSVQRENSVNSF